MVAQPSDRSFERLRPLQKMELHPRSESKATLEGTDGTVAGSGSRSKGEKERRQLEACEMIVDRSREEGALFVLLVVHAALCPCWAARLLWADVFYFIAMLRHGGFAGPASHGSAHTLDRGLAGLVIPPLLSQQRFLCKSGNNACSLCLESAANCGRVHPWLV